METPQQGRSLRATGFLRSVGVLASGAALSHAITALALPILTRLYSPADFSVLAVFSGLVLTISVAVCLRFDIAIPIPERDADAANIFAIALLSATAISAVLLGIVAVAGKWTAAALNQPRLEPYLLLLPLAVLFSGVYGACQFWFVRRKDFGAIAKVRVVQTSAGAGAQIGAGWLGWLSFGLLLGPTLNPGAGCARLIQLLVRTERQLFAAVTWSQMRSLFRTYDRFPKYSTLEALSNSAGIQLPVIAIAALAAGPEAGFLFLALYVMQAPMALIGSAVAQVYLSRAPEHSRAGELGTFTAGVLGGLFRAGVGPLLFAGIVAPTLSPLIFGNEWTRAGVLMAWMTPWFVMQFLASPVSLALIVANQQKTALVLQVMGLTFRLGAVFGASLVAINLISEAYALSGFVFYLTYLAVIFRAADVHLAAVAAEFRRGLPVVLAWAAGGGVVVLAVRGLQVLARNWAS